jgi:hypothetical protein
MFYPRPYLLIAAVSVLQFASSPVMAQTTVLTGAAGPSTMPKLIMQTPKYDTYSASSPQVQAAQVPRAPQRAQVNRVYVDRPVIRTVYLKDNRTYFQRHPKVKAATVGAGVGTAAGALTGLVSGRGVLRGGLIGAGTGAGVGLIRSSETMRRHPIIKNVATGSAVGLGLAAAASRHHLWAGTGVGAAAGLGYGLFKFLR